MTLAETSLPPGHDDAPVSPHNLRRIALLPKYDARAPRYTSYPTALQFHAGVDGQTFAGWLGGLPADQPVSVYIHVPFCRRLCWYCGCNMRVVNRQAPIDDYVEHLVEEIALLADTLPAKLTARSIHFGGGTPNVLSPENLTRLFETLHRVFDIPARAEIAAELDPALLTSEWVRAAASHGLNRASLGVQDLSRDVQSAVNRREPFDVVARSVQWLREAGIGSVNLDLMYGLPLQTEAGVLDTLEQVLTFRPDRIALFGYAHVPWAKPHQKLINEADLPDGPKRLAQAEAAARRLRRAGYVAIGMDHFAHPNDELSKAAREGRLHRNFQGYTTDAVSTLIGLGASSISRLPQGYARNSPDVATWRERVATGAFATIRGFELSGEDRFRGEIIERLMCDLAVDLIEVCAKHGRSLDEVAADLESLARPIGDFLVRLDGGRLEMTEFGHPFVRMVARAFDRRSATTGEGHSRAV